MNILVMSDELFDEPKIRYVGRSKAALGLGNPWTHINARQAMFYTSTPQAAIDNYRFWLIEKLVSNYISGMKFIGLEDWEAQYLSKVIQLSVDIELGSCDSLGCWCIKIINYLLVPDGFEKCHAEILYKACLKLTEHKQGLKK